MPRSNTPAHLQLAEMALRRAQKSVRGKVSTGIKKNVSGAVERKANSSSGGSSGLAQTALMFGITHLASRSVPGALLIGGGYLAKKWLDKRQQKDSEDQSAQ